MLQLVNLDDRVRQLMVAEVDFDLATDNLYMSPRLSRSGQRDYVDLLREAMLLHDEEWLADNLRHGRLNLTYQRRTRHGFSQVRMPSNAADTLAEGEFNRYYARALCRRCEEDSIEGLVVYRAKEVSQPRPGSEALIGRTMNAAVLLADLRTNVGVDTEHGMPGGPNSGLSVKLP